MFLQNLWVIFNRDLYIDDKLCSFIPTFIPGMQLDYSLSYPRKIVRCYPFSCYILAGLLTLFADSFNKQGHEFIAA